MSFSSRHDVGRVLVCALHSRGCRTLAYKSHGRCMRPVQVRVKAVTYTRGEGVAPYITHRMCTRPMWKLLHTQEEGVAPYISHRM